MKPLRVIALLAAALLLAALWWYPEWSGEKRRDGRFIEVRCNRNQLTTLMSELGGPTTHIALDEATAIDIFEEPLDPLRERPESVLEKRLAEGEYRIKRLFELINEGRVLRVPQGKLVRYVGGSRVASHIVEIEVFRRGNNPVRGFAKWDDLECFKLE